VWRAGVCVCLYAETISTSPTVVPLGCCVYRYCILCLHYDIILSEESINFIHYYSVAHEILTVSQIFIFDPTSKP
jgi:hypothetical protein